MIDRSFSVFFFSFFRFAWLTVFVFSFLLEFGTVLLLEIKLAGVLIGYEITQTLGSRNSWFSFIKKKKKILFARLEH